MSLTDSEKAELNTRLSAIEIVSWQWNEKGLTLLAAEGYKDKLKNVPEIGVIAQNVRNELQPLFANIILYHHSGALMVNYGLLAEIAKSVLMYLDKIYQNTDTDHDLHLSKLLNKYKTDDVQLFATRLLALIKVYNQKITAA